MARAEPGIERSLLGSNLEARADGRLYSNSSMLSEATINVAAPVSLADYTRPALIVPRLREADTAGIISELSHAFQREGCMPDVLPFYQAALNQELLANSALDCGLAFPHARLSAIKHLQFAFGRTSEAIVWGAKSSWRVQLIFLIAVPATDAAGYLQLLASLARLGQQPEVLAQLRATENPEAILAVLGDIKIRQG
jgi:mannitol/fructose-specific phosphotransferase system IIA component (Ntr-type)